jgi:hypothetical protein
VAVGNSFLRKGFLQSVRHTLLQVVRLHVPCGMVHALLYVFNTRVPIVLECSSPDIRFYRRTGYVALPNRALFRRSRYGIHVFYFMFFYLVLESTIIVIFRERYSNNEHSACKMPFTAHCTVVHP